MAQVSDDEKTLGLLAHLLGIISGFIGPLILFLVKKEGFAHENAKQALNFQISLIIYEIVAAILIFVLIGLLLLPAVALFGLIMAIVGAVKAHAGEVYKYPLAIPFIK